ncbi:MAG: prepilin-type N-terminal cleavage/methylation domain-containing protein [Kiritimatiellae bacterium]|nr:prepilin-type N-terminal cleavage/methylation domain-containing protein [Kiritimatiellia bacterium]
MMIQFSHSVRGEFPRTCATFQAGNGGFTILELLCAMTVLLVIAVMMGNIFTDSNKAWKMGMGQAENNTSGRAAVDYIARDLAQAVADTNLTFVIQPDRHGLNTYGMENDELCCVTVVRTPDDTEDPRSVEEVFYYVREMSDINGKALKGRYELARGHYGAAISDDNYRDHCYHDRKWWDGKRATGEVLVENVAGLRFYAYDEAGLLAGEPFDDGYKSDQHDDVLPMCVDVFLEVLSSDDSIRASALSGDDLKNFIERNAKRYTARAFFANRDGYRNRAIIMGGVE